MSTSLIALFQTQLCCPSRSGVPMDWTKLEDISQLIDAVRSDEERELLKPTFPKIMWMAMLSLYTYLHYPVAWCTFFYHNLVARLRPPPKCAFFGEFGDHNKMAIARPIPLSKFKAVANFKEGTVNDLFMSLALGSLKRYARRKNCKVFQSGAADKFLKLGIANYRPIDSRRFAEELRQFAVDGTNANKLDLAPFSINLQNSDVKSVQGSFHGFKYGATRPLSRFVFKFLSAIPGARRAQLEAGRSIVLTTSNVRGPSKPIPIPRRPKENRTDSLNEQSGQMDGKERKEEKEGFTPILFGMAVPGFLPINYTLMSYNGYCRVGLITNAGSVEDSEVLMQCFIDEWNAHQQSSVEDPDSEHHS